ncbi:hypothetical protein MesoLj131c_16350 [Mesorhizobium sp. 131-3-5]|uniref:hypothetical protein n=1 Tax=Mesorhizobium sp. 131-3-5 TaxID=2744520 RepID=UPI00192760DC|nr:hypothetical protein [Mesorhizobium sp. 131-3-5]BCH07377.1 hypothetical protein MesoLj131c_16350 [Mesorhizobium sp. 131-3-5]
MRKQINHARRHACFSATALRSQGYHQIGRGAFSKAFVHRDAPDVVIKVGKLYSKGCALTDGFPHFAQQLLDGEIHSKFFPKVYGLVIDVGEDAGQRVFTDEQIKVAKAIATAWGFELQYRTLCGRHSLALRLRLAIVRSRYSRVYQLDEGH